VLEVRLFGSLARHEAVPGSDADVLVVLQGHPQPRWFDRIPEFSQALQAAGLPVEVFPYTLQELDQMQSAGSGVMAEARRGVLLARQGQESPVMVQGEYPQFDEGLLRRMVECILSVGSPERIIMFGSRARGTARRGSDVDLLIIEDSPLPRYRRPVRYLQALVGLFPAKDVVVWTPAEVRAWQHVPNSFIATALREGRTLYER